MRNPLEVIARCFVIPKNEFRASRRQEEKFVPAEVVPLTTRLGKRAAYERVIKGTLTGLPTNYEQDGGNWIVNHAALDAEYEAQKKFREPVRVPDNILVTAFGIVELQTPSMACPLRVMFSPDSGVHNTA